MPLTYGQIGQSYYFCVSLYLRVCTCARGHANMDVGQRSMLTILFYYSPLSF